MNPPIECTRPVRLLRRSALLCECWSESSSRERRVRRGSKIDGQWALAIEFAEAADAVAAREAKVLKSGLIASVSPALSSVGVRKRTRMWRSDSIEA